MPGTLGRNLHLCFTGIRCPLEQKSPASALHDDHTHPLLIKNYNSLYDNNFDSNSKSLSRYPSSLSSSSSASSSSRQLEPDLATLFASERFFFSSPGRSNSIFESTPSISTESSDNLKCVNVGAVNDSIHHKSTVRIRGSPEDDHNDLESIQPWNSSAATVKDSVAVPTYSPDPYTDFRQSMQEMVEARELVDVKANWDYLHELLLCYLALNPKSTHKFIVGAFSDLLVSLLSSLPPKRE